MRYNPEEVRLNEYQRVLIHEKHDDISFTGKIITSDNQTEKGL